MANCHVGSFGSKRCLPRRRVAVTRSEGLAIEASDKRHDIMSHSVFHEQPPYKHSYHIPTRRHNYSNLNKGPGSYHIKEPGGFKKPLTTKPLPFMRPLVPRLAAGFTKSKRRSLIFQPNLGADGRCGCPTLSTHLWPCAGRLGQNKFLHGTEAPKDHTNIRILISGISVAVVRSFCL